MLAHPVSWLQFCLSSVWIRAGGLRAVAQIEDGAVGLGMTTFVSKVQSITERQKVKCRTQVVCSYMQTGCPNRIPKHASHH